jgi:2-dehydropantoate 2-reductase
MPAKVLIDGPILIAGTGALGSVIGGMLRANGSQVALLGRPRYLDAITHQGLVVDGRLGRWEARGFECFSEIGELRRRRFALILLTVKSYDTAAMAADLASLLAPGGVAVSVQNGLGNLEILAQHAGKENVLAARVIFGAEIDQPGRARVTVIAEPVTLGPAPNLSGSAAPALASKAERIAAALSAAGIPAQAVGDIRPWLWTKLFYNAALNPLGALLKLHYGALGEDPELRMIMDAIVHEAFAVSRRMEVRAPFGSADEYLAAFYGRLLPSTYDHRPSMLADLEYRGRTEIGALNGRIVELAAAMGLQAPANRMITALIRARERKWRPPPQEDR